MVEQDGHPTRYGEHGSALIYILIAIALLAALTVAFMGSSNQQTQSQNSFKLVSEVQSQIEYIRSAVQECVLSYPGGDIKIDITGGGTDTGADRRYPIKPNSTYFSGATVGPAADRTVPGLRCPGNPGDDKNHIGLFGGNTGKFMPPPPPLFNAWQWYNGTDGVFFWTQSSKTDAYIKAALDKLNASYATCEADVIDATAGAVTLDSGATVQCPAGNYCLRIWLKANMGTAVFPNESATCHA